MRPLSVVVVVVVVGIVVIVVVVVVFRDLALVVFVIATVFVFVLFVCLFVCLFCHHCYPVLLFLLNACPCPTGFFCIFFPLFVFCSYRSCSYNTMVVVT